jgi:hypothetical protein
MKRTLLMEENELIKNSIEVIIIKKMVYLSAYINLSKIFESKIQKKLED